MKKVTRKAIRKLQQFMERKGLVELPYTNLKLHDIAFKCDMDGFEEFCQDHWNIFEEYLDEKDLTLRYIGRTSSFYIVPRYYENAFYNKEFDRYGFYGNYIGGDLFNDMENEKNQVIDEFCKSIMDNEIKDFKESMIDVLNAYKYIEDFKENQVEIYNEWLELNS